MVSAASNYELHLDISVYLVGSICVSSTKAPFCAHQASQGDTELAQGTKHGQEGIISLNFQMTSLIVAERHAALVAANR